MGINKNTAYTQFFDLYNKSPEKVAFFTGAGISMPLFPSWKELLNNFLNYCHGQGNFYADVTEVKENIENGLHYLDIAEICVKSITEGSYRSFLETNISIPIDQTSIPSQAKELYNLPCTTFITTNFDRIPEHVCGGKYNVFTNKNPQEALRSIQQNNPSILKIHGDINDQESIIFTRSDYRKLMYGNEEIKTLLTTILNSKNICFIGYSISDPDFQQLLEYVNTISRGLNTNHYAFLNSKSAFEIETIKNRFGVNIIDYIPSNKSHPEIIEFIKSLSGTVIASNLGNGTLDSTEQINQKVAEFLVSMVGIDSLSIINSDKKFIISYLSRAGTPFELQREILSILKCFYFATNLIDEIIIHVHTRSVPSNEFSKFNALTLEVSTPFNIAQSFSKNIIQERVFWNSVHFIRPLNYTTILASKHKIEFPLIGIQ